MIQTSKTIGHGLALAILLVAASACGAADPIYDLDAILAPPLDARVLKVDEADDIVIEGREIAALAGAETEGASLPGDKPGEAMLDEADRRDVDLIVTGNKGMTGAKRFLLGSVPDYIAHRASCDVLIEHTSGKKHAQAAESN